MCLLSRWSQSICRGRKNILAESLGLSSYTCLSHRHQWFQLWATQCQLSGTSMVCFFLFGKNATVELCWLQKGT